MPPVRRPLLATLTAAAVATGGLGGRDHAAGRPGACGRADGRRPRPAAVKHVWVVVLENKSYAESFGPTTKAPYLTQLAKQGALLEQYYGIGHFSLPNYIALVSGQGPNVVTQADCPPYSTFNLGGPTVIAPTGKPSGKDASTRPPCRPWPTS